MSRPRFTRDELVLVLFIPALLLVGFVCELLIDWTL